MRKYAWERPLMMSNDFRSFLIYLPTLSTLKRLIFWVILNPLHTLKLDVINGCSLYKIRVSGTVVGPLITQKSPTCAYISQKPW